MNWVTVEQIVSDLRLASDPTDLASVIAELEKELVRLHPDRSGGEFPSDADREHYYKLSSALDFCKRHSQMLVPLATATALVREVAESMARATREPVEVRITRAAGERQANVKNRLRPHRVSLAAISAALGFVFFFPQQLADHPFLRAYIQGEGALIVWTLAVSVVAVLWFVVWIIERGIKYRIAWLFSLDCHRSLLRSIRGSKGRRFSRSDLRDEMWAEQHRARRDSPALFSLPGPVDRETIDQATNLAIERYVGHEWIRRIKSKDADIDDWFEILA